MFIFFQFSNINSIRMYFHPIKFRVFLVRTFDKQIQHHNHQHQCDSEYLHSGKESTCQCGRPRFDPWFGRIPWNGKWQPTPVFLPEKFPGQRSLVDYSPWSHKELDVPNDTHTQSSAGSLCSLPLSKAQLLWQTQIFLLFPIATALSFKISWIKATIRHILFSVWRL